MFSNKDLKNLIIPLFLEQLLTILVGLADTFIISFVSESVTDDLHGFFDGSLFPQGEWCVLYKTVDLQMEYRTAQTYFEDCSAE